MNLGVLSVTRRTTIVVLTLVFIFGGLISYMNLGRLEDPEFTIKAAVVTAPYPGASAEEVEREVTNEIERAIQRMGQIKRIESRSTRGGSLVEVTIRDQYMEADLPEVWDELRRKLSDVQQSLPPGAGPIVVDDDFGDVYGVYVGITGDGYTYRELKSYVDLLRRELLLVQDVKRVVLWGEQPEAIYVEMDRDRMAKLGITQEQIFATLSARNLAADGGRVRIGRDFVTIDPSGVFASEDQFKNLLISEPGAPELIYLEDVASVYRSYREPASTLMRMSFRIAHEDGKLIEGAERDGLDYSDPALDIENVTGIPAIGVAISTVAGGNVVTMGEAIQARMKELESLRPVGMELQVIALQSDSVTMAVNGFIVSLLQAIGIVVAVLLFVTGLKSGLLIGFIMYVSIAMSFCFLWPQGVMLERISLGALIIALGMLVDDAVVISEGMRDQIEAGIKPEDSARDVVGKNQVPLFAGAIISILAFGPIGLSDNSTGEFCRSLFIVLATTQLASWATGVTITPLFSTYLFRAKPEDQRKKDPYDNRFYRGFRRFLEGAIRFRYLTLTVVFALLALAITGFGYLPTSFFPESSRPQYYADVWLPQGSHIRDTEATAAKLEEFVMSRENSEAIATHVGNGAARFLLFYTAEKPDSAYAQLLINVRDYREIGDDMAAIEAWAEENLPDALVYAKRIRVGPGKFGNVQLRIGGPDRTVLRDLAIEAREIIERNPNSKFVRFDWGTPVPEIRPAIELAQARRNGIDRTEVARRFEASFEGLQVDVFREGSAEDEDRLVPVISRPPATERQDVSNIRDLQVYSPAADRMIPMRQIVSGFATEFVDPIVWRRNRLPTITLHSDQIEGETSVYWSQIAPELEAMFEAKRASGQLSAEYTFEWGGEHEDSIEANEALVSSIPMFALIMVLIVVLLFDDIRKTLIIWLTVPLALIGISAGLLSFNQPFNFMAVLGALSLSGMLIRNAIVLIERINDNLEEGSTPYEAIVDSAVSRLRPVALSSGTTVLGLIPLVQDPFFVAMAVAMMFGLTFATVLTLVVVPTMYASFFRIKSPQKG
jgi:multidrug efflux pump subunit AcrB